MLLKTSLLLLPFLLFVSAQESEAPTLSATTNAVKELELSIQTQSISAEPQNDATQTTKGGETTTQSTEGATTPAITESTTPRIQNVDTTSTTAGTVAIKVEEQITTSAPIVKVVKPKLTKTARNAKMRRSKSSLTATDSEKPLAELIHELIVEHKEANSQTQKKLLRKPVTKKSTKVLRKSKKTTKKSKKSENGDETPTIASEDPDVSKGKEEPVKKAKEEAVKKTKEEMKKKTKKTKRVSKKSRRQELISLLKETKLIIIRNGEVVDLTEQQLEDLDAVIKSMTTVPKKSSATKERSLH